MSPHSDDLHSQNSHEAIAAFKRAEKMRIDFVANVSHELRTPLTSIKGYTETLLHDLEDGRELDADFLKIILKNSNRLLDLINDLLDLSAIESRAEELSLAKLDTQELTAHVVKQVKHQAEEKNSSIQILSDQAPLYADPKRVEQVLTNLIENAIKYCPKNSTVTVAWSEVTDGTLLKVSDNGRGIAPKYLERLFERFYRLDKGRSRESGGTGLGLSIVKHIMHRHEGTVSVESELGQGTTFTCFFPSKISTSNPFEAE